MATIPILGRLNSVTTEQILAIAEQIAYNNTTVAATLDGKQDVLTFDTTPRQDSSNPITSGGVYSAIGNIQSTLVFDDVPTQNSENLVKSGGIYTALSQKQDTLSFDSVPKSGSTNPVTSGGIYEALAVFPGVTTAAEFNEMLAEVFPS